MLGGGAPRVRSTQPCIGSQAPPVQSLLQMPTEKPPGHSPLPQKQHRPRAASQSERSLHGSPVLPAVTTTRPFDVVVPAGPPAASVTSNMPGFLKLTIGVISFELVVSPPVKVQRYASTPVVSGTKVRSSGAGPVH